MEYLAHKLAETIAQSLNYDVEKRAVIAYGLVAIIQILITVFLVLAFGLLLDVPVEALIVCFSVSILRKYSGGAHAGSAELCTGIGVVYSVAAAFFAAKGLALVSVPIYVMIAMLPVYAGSFLILWKSAPMDSSNKPIRTEQKRARMKKKSLMVLLAYGCLSFFLLIKGQKEAVYRGYALSLLFGLSWQIFTLTKNGALLLHCLDKLFPNGKEVNNR